MFDDEFDGEVFDHDGFVELVVNGMMSMDNLPSEENCLETLEEVYNTLELRSIVALEIIQVNNLENIEKELSEGDIVDYNEKIKESLLDHITALYFSPSDARSLFEDNEDNDYVKFLVEEIDAVYNYMLGILKMVYENR